MAVERIPSLTGLNRNDVQAVPAFDSASLQVMQHLAMSRIPYAGRLTHALVLNASEIV